MKLTNHSAILMAGCFILTSLHLRFYIDGVSIFASSIFITQKSKL